MAVSVLTCVNAWFDGYDLTTQSNAAALNYGADMVEATVFCEDTHRNVGGLKVVDASVEGYWESTQDAALFAAIGAPNKPLTIAPEGSDAGDVAFFHLSVESSYGTGAAVGELLPFSFASQASDQSLIRGNVLHRAAVTTSAKATPTPISAPRSVARVVRRPSRKRPSRGPAK